MRLAQRVDNLIGFFLPGVASELALLRHRFEQISQFAYKTAKEPNKNNARDRGSKSYDANDHLNGGQLEELRERGLQLDRDNPIASAILDISTDLVIGDGIKINIKCEDKEWADLFEKKWRDFWVFGKPEQRKTMSGPELERHLYRLKKAAGDCLIIHTQDGDIQVIEPHLIGSEKNEENVFKGVKYNNRGRVTGYFIKRKEGRYSYKYIPIAADFATLYKNSHRFSSYRGVTAFRNSANFLDMLEEYADLSLKAVKISTGNVLFITRKDTSGRPEFTKVESSDGKVSYKETQNGARIINGKIGEDAKVLSGTAPVTNFEQFFSVMHRIVCVNFGVTLEVGAMNFQGSNFSQSKMSLGLSNMVAKKEHSDFVKNVLIPIIKWKAVRWMAAGELPFRALDSFEVISSNKPTISPDQKKDEEAKTLSIKNGTSSIQEVCRKENKEASDVLKENAELIKEAKELADELDVPWQTLVPVFLESMSDKTPPKKGK